MWNLEVTTQRDCLEERFCFVSMWFLRKFGPLSIVGMFHYIHFPQIIHSTHVGNRKKCVEKTRYTEWNKPLYNLNFLFGKKIVLIAHSVKRLCFRMLVPNIALFSYRLYSLLVSSCPPRGLCLFNYNLAIEHTCF